MKNSHIRKIALMAGISAAISMIPAAQAAVIAFDSNPTANSINWANQIASLGASVNTAIDFETHPLGALQGEFYAGLGVHMSLAGSNLVYNAVQDYKNDYGGTTSGYGPNSSGEGIASESRNFGAYNPNGSWTLTLSFDQAVLGAGLYVIDLFNGLGNRTTTLAAYDGMNGTGNLLSTASAPAYNFQLYNKLFLGVAQDGGAAAIHSVVFTNPYPYYGDGIALDDIRFATAAVPVPAAAWLLGSGLLGLIGVARRKAA